MHVYFEAPSTSSGMQHSLQRCSLTVYSLSVNSPRNDKFQPITTRQKRCAMEYSPGNGSFMMSQRAWCLPCLWQDAFLLFYLFLNLVSNMQKACHLFKQKAKTARKTPSHFLLGDKSRNKSWKAWKIKKNLKMELNMKANQIVSKGRAAVCVKDLENLVNEKLWKCSTYLLSWTGKEARGTSWSAGYSRSPSQTGAAERAHSFQLPQLIMMMWWVLICRQLGLKIQYFQAPEVLFGGFYCARGDLRSDCSSASEGQNDRNVAGDAAKWKDSKFYSWLRFLKRFI